MSWVCGMGSFVDYVPVLFVDVAFEWYVVVCLRFCTAWTIYGLSHVIIW